MKYSKKDAEFYKDVIPNSRYYCPKEYNIHRWETFVKANIALGYVLDPDDNDFWFVKRT